MVDDFQKKYEALQIPYPKDTLTSQIEQQATQQKSEFDAFVSKSKTRIASADQERAKWEAMMPVEQMTLEEAKLAVNHLVVDYDRDTIEMWPYDEDWYEWRKKTDELLARGDVDAH